MQHELWHPLVYVTVVGTKWALWSFVTNSGVTNRLYGNSQTSGGLASPGVFCGI